MLNNPIVKVIILHFPILVGIGFSGSHSSQSGATSTNNVSNHHSPATIQGSPMNSNALPFLEEQNER